MAGGIRMSWDGLVNMSERICVFSNNRAYRTVCIE